MLHNHKERPSEKNELKILLSCCTHIGYRKRYGKCELHLMIVRYIVEIENMCDFRVHCEIQLLLIDVLRHSSHTSFNDFCYDKLTTHIHIFYRALAPALLLSHHVYLLTIEVNGLEGWRKKYAQRIKIE